MARGHEGNSLGGGKVLLDNRLLVSFLDLESDVRFRISYNFESFDFQPVNIF